MVSNPVSVSPALGKIIAGDTNNFANLFPSYCYDLSRKSVEECVLIGLHGMRIARKLNSGVVGEPNVWVLRQGVLFRRLTATELATYTAQSEALDANILGSFRTALRPGSDEQSTS
jgi:hypothetical protein